jgi:hypothetical protein
VVATPFQLARLVSAVANGGEALQGRWIAGPQNSRLDPPVRVLQPPQAEMLAGFMRLAVTEGTGAALRDLPVAVAGKTGTAEVPGGQSHSWVSKLRVNLGRLANVTAQSNRLIRHNDIAFADDGTPTNTTVAREHAHIELDRRAGRYRLYDDTHTRATAVVRGSDLLTVPSFGLELRYSDEIRLGKAAISFEEPPGAAGALRIRHITTPGSASE